MAQTAANVRVGVTGNVYVAPTGSTAPTDATTSLNAAFLELGYLSDEGLKVNHNDEVQDIKAWQNASVVRKVTTSSDIEFEFTLIETNLNVMEFWYKKDMEVGDVSLLESGVPAKLVSMVFQVVDGSNIQRIYLPSCEITERGEIAYTSEGAVSYPTTVTAYESSGVKVSNFWAAALT